MRKFLLVLLAGMMMTCNAKTLSKSGREFIKNIEQCSLTRYWDNGAWSIGYGHRIPKGTKQYVSINRKQAERLLLQDLKMAEQTANKILKELHWNASQSFYDGLVSVIYNCGQGGIYKTEFYKRLKACRSKNGKVNTNDLNFTVAAIKNARIPAGKYADGVRDRRWREHKMMLG